MPRHTLLTVRLTVAPRRQRGERRGTQGRRPRWIEDPPRCLRGQFRGARHVVSGRGCRQSRRSAGIHSPMRRAPERHAEARAVRDGRRRARAPGGAPGDRRRERLDPRLGFPGYDLSVEYAADVLRAAGYAVTIQEFEFQTVRSRSSRRSSSRSRRRRPARHSLPHSIMSLLRAGDVIGAVSTPSGDFRGCDGRGLRRFPRRQHRAHLARRPTGSRPPARSAQGDQRLQRRRGRGRDLQQRRRTRSTARSGTRSRSTSRSSASRGPRRPARDHARPGPAPQDRHPPRDRDHCERARRVEGAATRTTS